jgi:glutamyl endopeptidase
VSNINVTVPIRASGAPEVELAFDGNVGVNDPALGAVRLLLAQSIVPPEDDRRLVDPNAFPFRAVVSIIADGLPCSGWLYGVDVVATAGHCVYKGGRFFTTVTVRPAGSRGIGCNARALFTTVGWTLSDERYDYGAIKLACELGVATGWLGYGWGQDIHVNTSTILVGYGIDAAAALKLYSSPGTIDAVHNGQLFYTNDTGGAASGGPVIVDSVCLACAVAIHAKPLHLGLRRPHRKSNHGALISREVFENMRAWKELPY